MKVYIAVCICVLLCPYSVTSASVKRDVYTCTSSSCLNGGTCTEYNKCLCLDDWTGDRCETRLDVSVCEFETDLCGYVQDTDDDFDWTKISGKTRTPSTGPTTDHTHMNSDGSYMYIEVSGIAAGSKASLKKLEQSSENDNNIRNCTYTFWYHMYGSDIGTLNIMASDMLMWTKSGDQGDEWHEGRFTFSVSTSDVWITIEGSRGPSYRGDIAIDDLELRCTSGALGGGSEEEENKCESNTDNCHKQATCADTPESFTCQCNDGYMGDGIVCTDVNECNDSTDNCDDQATCENTPGSFTCQCNEGYDGDGVSCTDINECTLDYHNCHEHATCTNTDGSFMCECNAGYGGDGTSCTRVNDDADVSLCDFETDLCNYIQDTDDNFDWTKGSGKTPTSSTGPTTDHTKMNSEGSYLYIEVSGKTAGVNANLNMRVPAASNARNCTFTLWYHMYGSTVGTLNIMASDSLKWTESGDQGDEWHEGSFTFSVARSDIWITIEGIRGTSYRGDIAIDDLELKCDSGVGDEIDECALGTDDCHEKATCTDTPESFTCRCNDGYTGDGTSCTDSGVGDEIDECALDTDDCHEKATCTDTSENFTCRCNDGYAGDGTSCTDVNECAADTDNCDMQALCTNTPGSFTCKCNEGYDGDGSLCNDKDECHDSTDNCDDQATCENSPGSFTCQCNEGYDGDGVSCTDINECTLDYHNCHEHATCTNTDGSFTCKCNAGYGGDGFSCTRVNDVADVSFCDFETDLCGYVQDTDDNFDWTRHSGNTLTSSTGPTTDHTHMTSDGSYMYIEVSGKTAGSQANLDMFVPAASNARDYTFTFWYHMYGSTVGTLNIMAYDTLKWTESGDQGDEWHEGSFTFSVSTSDVWITIEGIRGQSYRGDIAIDDLELKRGSTPTPENTYVLRCDFETDYMCGFTQTTEDDFDWEKQSGETLSLDTGPSFDHTLMTKDGSYMYIEVTSIEPGSKATLKRLISKLDYTFDCTFKFWYHMFGSYIGTLEVIISDGTSGTLAHWTESGNQGDEWHEGSLPFVVSMSDVWIQIVGVRGQDFEGDIAIDDLEIGCDDVWDTNECASGTDNCDERATCTDTPASFTCKCNDGFTGDGIYCRDIDECFTKTHNCHSYAKCRDTFGSYNCECEHGFRGNGFECSDINECEDVDACSYNATCTNSIGSYVCSCNNGYKGNGETCSRQPLRLIGGNTRFEGTVEIYFDDSWSTICDSDWGYLEAKVACKQLGYPYDECLMALNESHFGPGSGQTVMDSVRCEGDEKDLLDCSYREFGIDCGINNHAGIVCTSHSYIRLEDRTTTSDTVSGRVQMVKDGYWGNVCNKNWDDVDAKVVCRQLGLPYDNARGYSTPVLASQTPKWFIDHVKCDGNEHELHKCSKIYTIRGNCEFASVTCSDGLSIDIKPDLFDTGICGTREVVGGRIVGGQDAAPGDWPWAVVLHVELNGKSSLCGATLINTEWAVTAAHCADEYTVITVILGDTSEEANGQSEFRVERTARAFCHPDYIKSRGYKRDNDICLLKLNDSVTFNKYIRPACLSIGQEEHTTYESCYVVGWGAISEDGRSSNKLQELATNLITNRECKASTQIYYDEISENMICTATGSELTSCQGDSGGPVVCLSGSNTWHLVGVTSWGDGCGRDAIPDVLARVSRYTRWLYKVVAEN